MIELNGHTIYGQEENGSTSGVVVQRIFKTLFINLLYYLYF